MPPALIPQIVRPVDLHALTDDDDEQDEQEQDEMGADIEPLPALPAPKAFEHLNTAKQLARDNPAAVAGIVRTWVNGEPAVAKA